MSRNDGAPAGARQMPDPDKIAVPIAGNRTLAFCRPTRSIKMV